MELETFNYSREKGWSTGGKFPALDSAETLVVAFAAPGFLNDVAPLKELRKAFPKSKLLGCSTAGEIFGTKISDESISIAAMHFARTKLRMTTVPVMTAERSCDAGRAIARELAGPDLRAVFVLSEGIHVNGSELIRGLNENLPGETVVTGGLAGDGSRFQSTWILADSTPSPQAVVAVGFYGNHLKVGHGSKGGWDIFGAERVVTKSKGNVLYELDGKPALQLYKSYLGERAAGLPATALLFPLALRSGPKDPDSFVRTVLSVDEDAQTMTFAGDIPEGYLAQLMKANFDRLIDGASGAATLASKAASGAAKAPTLCVAISCVGRRLVLGERTEEEVEATLDILPPGTKQIGFYSYGEISPHASGKCDLHNQTMTLTTISEE